MIQRFHGVPAEEATFCHIWPYVMCRIIGNMCESNIDLCDENTFFSFCDSNSIEGFFSPVMRTKERTPRISCIFDVMIFN